MRRAAALFSLCCIMLVFCAVPVGAAQKDWTVLVFINADNNLDSFGVEDQIEMQNGGGSNEWMNIVSILDREHGPAVTSYVQKDKLVTIKEHGEVDMGDYKFFANWVVDMAKAYPAKHYCVIMWNHGSGWKNVNHGVIKGISFDDSSGNHITTNQLTLATDIIRTKLGKKLDVLCFDACLMQMVEITHALRKGCDYVVASEQVEPGEGYPYAEIVSSVKKGMSPRDFAGEIVKQYAASYSGGSAGSSSTTQSSVECAKLDALADAINGFAKVAIAGNFAKEFKVALDKVQRFYYRTNIDLIHLVKLLKTSIKDPSFQNAATKLEAAATAAVAKNALSGYSCNNSYGIAVYFPTSSYSWSSAYSELAFAKDTLWDEMALDYYKKYTASTIAADVTGGDMSSLLSYVRTANEFNREVSAHLISTLNFAVFAENQGDQAVRENVKNLLQELKNK